LSDCETSGGPAFVVRSGSYSLGSVSRSDREGVDQFSHARQVQANIDFWCRSLGIVDRFSPLASHLEKRYCIEAAESIPLQYSASFDLNKISVPSMSTAFILT